MFEHEPAVRATATQSALQHPRPASRAERVPPIIERLAVVYRYGHLIVWTLLLAIAGALLKTYSTLPMFGARAQLLIDLDRQAVDVFRESAYYYQDPEPFLETQYRVLQSRDLARRVVRQLDLAHVAEFNGARTRSTGAERRVGIDRESHHRAAPPIPSSASRR